MNEVVRHARPEMGGLPGDRAAVTGTLTQIGHVVEQLRQAGKLISVSNPIPDGRPGHVVVTVRLVPVDLRPRHTTNQRPRRRWTRRRIGVTTGVVGGVLGG